GASTPAWDASFGSPNRCSGARSKSVRRFSARCCRARSCQSFTRPPARRARSTRRSTRSRRCSRSSGRFFRYGVPGASSRARGVAVAMLGHSVGEYVALVASGVLHLSDALGLVARRARLMQGLGEKGAMAALFTDEGKVAEALGPYGAELSIAAINGPGETV